jgi:cell division transport system ATP-binding protein
MVKFNKVSVAFRQQPIFSKVDLHVRPGEFVSLVGETGVGKTTLLRLIYFDLLPDEGNITVGEYDSLTISRRDIPRLRRTLGIVFQDFKLLDDRSVYENVRFALEVTGVQREEIDKRALRVLADVGLSHKRNNMPEELSGGEQQRVVIARALVNKPMLLLADEPTGNLDRTTSMEILQLLKTINAQGTAIILASHNYDVVRKSSSRILKIEDGLVKEIPSL